MRCQNRDFDFGLARSPKKICPAGADLWDPSFKINTYIYSIQQMSSYVYNTLSSTLFEVLKKSRELYEVIATSNTSLRPF
jgi:hypothetical protein